MSEPYEQAGDLPEGLEGGYASEDPGQYQQQDGYASEDPWSEDPGQYQQAGDLPEGLEQGASSSDRDLAAPVDTYAYQGVDDREDDWGR
jgi:hypothetical protein